jgi:hypothetical protein
LGQPGHAQQAFAADGPSSVFIEAGLGTLSQSFVEGFVAAAEMRALGCPLRPINFVNTLEILTKYYILDSIIK